MISLSIIIPVYNIKKELKRCLDSIVSQDTSQCEIILVNDGSTDGSDKLCDYYNGIYDNLTVLHQSNGGLSHARNEGLRIAQGEYIWFVDGDDYLDKDAINIILNRINSNSEIYIINHYNIIQEKKIEYNIKYPDNIVSKGIEYLKLNCAIQAWVSICKRNFLINNNLFFVRNLYHEDFEFSIRLYSLATKVEHINYPLYNYINDRVGSIMNQSSSKSAIGYATSALTIKEFLKELSFSTYEKKIINAVVANGICFSMKRTKNLSRKDLSLVSSFYIKNIKYISYFMRHSTNIHYLISFSLYISPILTFKLYNLLRRNNN